MALELGSVAQAAENRLEGVYGAFACPNPNYVAALDALVPIIVREYTAGLCATFVGRNAERIAGSSDGLIEYLGKWFANAELLDPPLWDYGFGNLYRSIGLMNADHGRGCAVIAARLAGASLHGSWRARFETPLRLRIGQWLLPSATRVSLLSSGDEIVVEHEGTNGAATVKLIPNEDGFYPSGCTKLCQVAHHGVEFDLLASDALDLAGFPEFEGRVVSAIEPGMVSVFYDAIDIIRSYTPEYLPWIARVLHQVFLLKPTGKRVESGSVENYLGLIHLSAHPEPLPVAELLVHEATHQYMNVLRKLQPLDDGSDSRRYWSPPVNANRPISKIIAALHAFGNVQIFYRLCAARGLPNQTECARQDSIMQEWLDALIPPTIGNPSISPTGAALCQPLIAKLRA